MIGKPRVIPRDQLWPAMRHERSDPDRPSLRCRASIALNGKVYRCGRGTSGIDAFVGRGHHEGIHDAFVEHGDGGAVRW